MGIDTQNGFSSNADELINAANFYQNTVVRGFQLNILNTLQTIFSVNNMDLPVEFVQLKPITVQFDSKTIREVMTVDEIRADLGLEPLGDKNTVEQDVKLSEVEKCNCSEKTELDSFIEEFGEDIPEDWELIDEEIVDGEHQDFDYEAELNRLANDKTELASTGTARPNARSSQDGTNKADNEFYKVRYVYTKDNFLTQEGSTREFCSKMMSARKVYRKEDIIQMGSRAVNAGWGPRGADTYSIWLYIGGGNCHHFWLRQIYKTSLRGAKSNIKPSQAISYTKALSEGFTAERNDKLVARPPKRMKNNGFLEPR